MEKLKIKRSMSQSMGSIDYEWIINSICYRFLSTDMLLEVN